MQSLHFRWEVMCNAKAKANAELVVSMVRQTPTDGGDK